MKKFFGEFRKFITRGNIVDMSVGVIVGGAFTAVVNGLSNFILKPIINWILAAILGKNSLSGIYTYLGNPVYKDVLDDSGAVIGKEVDLANSIYIDWGAFINAIINFLIIAFVLFLIVRTINNIQEANKKMQNMKSRIEYKQEKKIPLNKKEKAFLEAENKRLSEEEARRIAEEEAAKNTPKPVTSEDLLAEIRDLLKERN